MRIIVKQLLIFTLLIFTLPTETIGQIAKGDYFFDFSSLTYHSNRRVKPPIGSFEITYMKLISNKIMLGGSIYFQHNNKGIIYTQKLKYYTFNEYTINPTVRYYFTNKKIAVFAQLQNNISLTRYENENLFANKSGYQAIVGIGFNYFLGKNILVETKLTSNLINTGEFKDNSIYISFSSGVKLFLNSNFENQIDSLPNKILKKGIISTSTILSFRNKFESYSNVNFNFSPNLRYFITDRFNLFASYNYSQYRYSTYKQHSTKIGIGAEHYFKLSNQFYINIGISGFLDIVENQVIKSYRKLNIPISTTANYFHKQKRIYLGSRYNFNDLTLFNNKREDNTFSIYGGLDYYILDNIYFNGNINLMIIENSPYSSNHRYVSLTFGVGFILDSNDIQF